MYICSYFCNFFVNLLEFYLKDFDFKAGVHFPLVINSDLVYYRLKPSPFKTSQLLFSEFKYPAIIVHLFSGPEGRLQLVTGFTYKPAKLCEHIGLGSLKWCLINCVYVTSLHSFAAH